MRSYKGKQFAREIKKVHDLKILPKYFVRAKSFELRKKDRDFQVGDIVVLREWDKESGYTGRQSTHIIQYILEDAKEYGLADGYCILALSDVRKGARKMRTYKGKKQMSFEWRQWAAALLLSGMIGISLSAISRCMGW